MDKDLKDQRQNNRWLRATGKMPLRRLIRFHNAESWMRSEKGRRIKAAIQASVYENQCENNFEELWQRINKPSSVTLSQAGSFFS